MARQTILAKCTTGDGPGIVLCYGARAGDVVFQAMALSNGDDVTGVFDPCIPGADKIVQNKPAPGIECLIQLHRHFPDGA